jgi:toxin-antitoxin system PIN domain toxin
MDAPDVNVLVHAFRPDSSDHALCRAWLDRRLQETEPLAIIPMVLAGFVRVAAHPRVFRNPSRLAEALEFCDYLRATPHCRQLEAGSRHWKIFSDLCRETQSGGNDIPDAWLAAIAIEHRCRWITLDRGFARFPGLRIDIPSAG